MTNVQKIIGVALVGILVLGLYFVLQPRFAAANPSLFITALSNSSTSSPSFMSSGLGTTTTVFDAQALDGSNFAANSVSLLVQFAATNTPATTLNLDIQYSQDGQDWYAVNQGTEANLQATTSDSIGNVQTISFLYASSTIDRISATPLSLGQFATSTRIVNLNMPTRYARAVIYMTGASGKGSVWTEWVAKKENR